MLNNLAPVHAARSFTEPPTITIPAGCGFEGDKTVVLQVMINSWDGQVTGASLNVAKGKWHRLAVTRMADLVDYQDERRGEEVDRLLRTKCGKKGVDRALRPDTRFDALLPIAGPYGLSKINMTPWVEAMRQINAGLAWCIDAANSHKLEAFALLLVADITEPRYIEPERYRPYWEVDIVGIRAAEVLKLNKAEALSVAEVERTMAAPRTQAKPKQPTMGMSSFSDDE